VLAGEAGMLAAGVLAAAIGREHEPVAGPAAPQGVGQRGVGQRGVGQRGVGQVGLRWSTTAQPTTRRDARFTPVPQPGGGEFGVDPRRP
jgi:hypothetical protein